MLAFFLLASSWLRAAGAGALTPPAAAINDPAAGQSLAADLRRPPLSEAEIRGTLKLRQRDGSTTNVPVKFWNVFAGNSWQAFYAVTDTNRSETLTVLHSPNQPNEYRLTRGLASNCVATAPLATAEIWQPFAGSDFSLADLGTEFLQWPTQVLVRNEMRKNRACHVLESRPAITNAYARVLSWVDVESVGIVLAEAYGLDGKRVKEFEVNGLTKVGDRWEVREMEIRDLKKRSRTILEFDLTEN
ncbi:MAG: outer membrane lipoprotein-sorting protein [Verrucomicrobia bacterium]|nr:outer membrane lipoprotein-sorting protein [Verrucomicrobiota bacterium]